MIREVKLTHLIMKSVRFGVLHSIRLPPVSFLLVFLRDIRLRNASSLTRDFTRILVCI